MCTQRLVSRPVFPSICHISLSDSFSSLSQGSRFASSNLEPQALWDAGVQLVAINYQTYDVGQALNLAKFSANGCSGYVLKPRCLRGLCRGELAGDTDSVESGVEGSGEGRSESGGDDGGDLPHDRAVPAHFAWSRVHHACLSLMVRG